MKLSKAILTVLISLILAGTSTLYSQIKEYPKLDVAEVAAFLDSMIVPMIDNNRTPGAGIVIVQGDSIFFSKGYGYSDIENQFPVDPQKTLFRTASVCKTVTATVVLKARDEGLVDMNTDVNEYLKLFKVPEKFGKPITLQNLLTHTPGFDDIYIGKSARTKEDALPLGEFLGKNLPERVMPPGEVYSYSNIGNALAAYVVEEASGEDYEKFAKEHLFDPLEMNTSSFRLKDFQKENLYKGYYQENGNFVEFPFDYILDYPAGQMLTPLNEFAHFMIMHLNNGKYEGRQVIDSSTIEEMHSVQFTHHPKLYRASGYAFGISEFNGLKNLAHGGGYIGISTLMFLFPEIKLGLYAVTNTSSGIPGEIITSFMNHFYPYEEPKSEVEYPLTDLPEYDKDVDKFTGKYRNTRYSRNTITKVGVLMDMLGLDMPIWKNDDGMIMMYDHKGDERRLIQIEPNLFQSIDDDYFMAFRTEESGKVTHVFTDGTASLEKLAWYEELWFNKILGLTLLTIFFLTVILFFISKFSERRKDTKSVTHHLLKASAYAAGSYLLYIIIYAALMFFVVDSVEMQVGMAYGMPWYFYIVQGIPFIGFIYTVLLLYKMFAAAKVFSKVKFGFTVSGIVFITSAAMIWFLNYWSLLGWRF